MKTSLSATFSSIVLVCVVAVTAYYFMHNSPNFSFFGSDSRTIYVNGSSVIVDIATSSAAREKGLSERESLSPGSGMLFVFPTESSWGFWMKDMHFPIDIIWIDNAGTIITISADTSPDSFPQVFYPTGNARFVLEVPAGFAAAHHVSTGDTIIIPSYVSKLDSQ